MNETTRQMTNLMGLRVIRLTDVDGWETLANVRTGVDVVRFHGGRTVTLLPDGKTSEAGLGGRAIPPRYIKWREDV